MTNQQIINALSITSQLIKAQDLIQTSIDKTKQLIKQAPNLYLLAEDVRIDLETAQEAMQDAEQSSNKLFDKLQGGRP